MSEQGFERVCMHNQGSGLESPQELIVSFSDGMISWSGMKSVVSEHRLPNEQMRSNMIPNVVSPSEDRAVEALSAKDNHLPPSQSFQTFIESTVKRSFFDALGIRESSVDPHKPFRDYGIDSITGVNVINALNEQLGIQLKTIVLFDYTTIADLSEYIINEYKDQIRMDSAEFEAAESEDPLKTMLRQLEQGLKTVEDVNDFLERII
ncbi:acyl carrier protein [Paenibacillus bouchesdurhonensis]|uniref:acyl carrier protein n=1 Tax=Paenibacillus bouchesdurhonensis TaxID=1870990 RepID=UPI000DA62FF6|nr:acyl carrier protein [Paenibacillus bouchesdurhonensis]